MQRFESKSVIFDDYEYRSLCNNHNFPLNPANNTFPSKIPISTESVIAKVALKFI